jgi:hypothetical protein
VAEGDPPEILELIILGLAILPLVYPGLVIIYNELKKLVPLP